jgi:hypothetical protein
VQAAVSAHPDRFAAFAALPMSDPTAAVRELDRTANELGFKGALINGRADGRFLDDPKFFPILERARALNGPLYLHPGLPTETLRQELYSDLEPSVAFALGVSAWGWHAQAGLHALRLIVSRVFDRLPDLQISVQLQQPRPSVPRRHRGQSDRQGKDQPPRCAAPAGSGRRLTAKPAAAPHDGREPSRPGDPRLQQTAAHIKAGRTTHGDQSRPIRQNQDKRSDQLAASGPAAERSPAARSWNRRGWAALAPRLDRVDGRHRRLRPTEPVVSGSSRAPSASRAPGGCCFPR